jgi:hypothetical protein
MTGDGFRPDAGRAPGDWPTFPPLQWSSFTPALTQMRLLFSVLDVRERLIAGLALLAGMRPGEISGLKWVRLEADHADIRQRVYRGDVDSPKSVRSVRFAALSDGLRISINEWRAMSPWTGADAWVFPSEKLTTPLAKDNCWRRSFLPKLKPVGLDWANFQVMRRTHSSLLKELDVDPQVRAEQMGHTVDVNENVYTITSLKRRKEAVNALEKAIGDCGLYRTLDFSMLLEVIENMERETGLEPATSSLGSWHSTTELLPPSVKSSYLVESVRLPRPRSSLFRPCCLSKYYPFGCQSGQQNRQNSSLRILTDSPRSLLPMLSVHAVRSCCPFMLSIFALRSWFQAQNSTAAGWMDAAVYAGCTLSLHGIFSGSGSFA